MPNAFRHLAVATIVGAAVLLIGAVAAPSTSKLPFSILPVHADDGDDGGDDSGDDGGASNPGRSGTAGRTGGRRSGNDSGLNGPIIGGGQRGLFDGLSDLFEGNTRQRRTQRRSRRARAVAPAPAAVLSVPNEIVVIGLSDAERTALTAGGYEALESLTIALTGDDLTRLSTPQGRSLEEARADIAAISPAALADLNHFYAPERAADQEPDAIEVIVCEGLHCPDRDMISWPHATAGSCGPLPTIGLIDTRINTEHEALADRNVERIDFGDETEPDSSAQHGTAVAVLLVGSAETRTPGLLPNASLIAIDPFTRKTGNDRAALFALVQAIDQLIARDAELLNLSLSGPENVILERIINAALTDNRILVAAAGNDGPSADPVYPAGYDGVVTVTAVSRSERIYRRAGRGDHIDFAAPGVEVWTAASIRGARPKTGTSFAVPFVTAALALARAEQPDMPPSALVDRLHLAAKDLGDDGPDEIFGWGLLQTDTLCRQPDVAG